MIVNNDMHSGVFLSRNGVRYRVACRRFEPCVALDDAANRSLPLGMTLDFCVAAGEPLGTSGPVILCEQGEGEGGEGEGGCAEGGMGAGVALLVLVRRRSGEARRG